MLWDRIICEPPPRYCFIHIRPNEPSGDDPVRDLLPSLAWLRFVASYSPRPNGPVRSSASQKAALEGLRTVSEFLPP